ncbi:nucleolar protein 3 isoform X3 [Carlito syrichta]|uniref:Nucleolar protein 3 isoform X3 n=1 Tax=Carlito syrichta TaxID=1868482 RepID=A0A3Q0E9W9_CARSF|nr:nucleolar protein 3 isoform X3 [Carlito syrichta]
MGNAQERPSETIDRERKRLVETLQEDSGLLLDALVARGVLTGPEYEALDALPDAERRATGTVAMTLRAQATGRLRLPTRGPHAPGYPDLLNAVMVGILRALKRCNPRPQRNQSQRRKLRPLKRLSWIRNQSRRQNRNQNQSRRQNRNQNQSQSQSVTQNRTLTQNPSLTQSQSPTSRRGMSPKIPEGQIADQQFLAQAGWDLGSC